MPAAPMMATQGRANIDGVFTLLGVTHPCILIQFLISFAFLVLGLGTMENSTLLPIPLYGCWGGMTSVDFVERGVCRDISLLPRASMDDKRQMYVCGGSGKWWHPDGAPGGAALVVARALLCILAGIGIDVVGRRRSAIVWMLLYFVFAFSRSFAPLDEVISICLTVEGVAAQATSMALLLIATEGSTQKECIRSASVVLLGHTIGMSVFIPIINTYCPEHIFRQLARSLPSVISGLLLFLLPESVRWLVTRGRLEYISKTIQRSHNTSLDDDVKPKILAVFQETRTSLSQAGCRGSAFRESLMPMVRTLSMFRIWAPLFFLSLAYGFGAAFRSHFDSNPYGSIEDRIIAYGATEAVALQLLGLLLARLPVRRVMPATCILMAALLPLNTVLQSEIIKTRSCVGEVLVSCLGHFSVVMTGMWLVLSTIRLTPTHSRGAMMGIMIALATVGHAVSNTVHPHMPASWGPIYHALLWSGIILLCGILSTCLPPTPPYLPDTLAHLTPRPIRKLDPGMKEEQRADEENTRL